MNVIAILTSDWHLCHKAPIARSAEPDWYAAMRRPLCEITQLASKYNAPVIIAGDIFDRWNSPPELINFALDELDGFRIENGNFPNLYAIPGQHDLPNHRLDEVKRSAYYTLLVTGIFKNLEKWEFFCSDALSISAFAWGEEIIPHDQDRQPENDRIQLAVVHSYIWKDGCSYPGADEKQKIGGYGKSLEGYDAAVFGDNHKGFKTNSNIKPHIINCGTLMRRKIDEIDYQPQVGLLLDDGDIIAHHLDVSKDKFIDVDEAREKEKQEIDATQFLTELKNLGADSLDFRDAVHKYMNKKNVSEDVRENVLGAIE